MTPWHFASWRRHPDSDKFVMADPCRKKGVKKSGGQPIAGIMLARNRIPELASLVLPRNFALDPRWAE